jgi:Calcineurin-like phosphoesterase
MQAIRGRARHATAAVTLCVWLAACSHVTPYAVPSVSMPPPAADAVDQRILLIGDTGAPDPSGEPALQTLSARVSEMPERTTVVFLGDVVYETGMPQPSPIEGTPVEEILDQALLNLYESRHEAERRVKDQIKAVDFPGTRAVVIPGNHDWDQFGVGGWKSVRELGAYLQQAQGLTRAKIDFLPGGGCPGPSSVDVGARGRVIVLDTQWWLEVGAKPTPTENPTNCPYTTEADVTAALVRELRAAHDAGRIAIVVGHHPLRSKGPHGGYVDPLVHVFPMLMLGSYVPFFVRWFPLPVLGTIGATVRGWRSPSPQDVSGPGNRHMRRALSTAMAEAGTSGAAPLVYAAGHDHSLQIFRGDRAVPYTLVSGFGSRVKSSEVRHDGATLFAHANPAHPGFMQLDLLRDGRARLAVIEWAADTPTGTEVYAMALERRDRGQRTAAPSTSPVRTDDVTVSLDR